jgi:hypothetical protein
LRAIVPEAQRWAMPAQLVVTVRSVGRPAPNIADLEQYARLHRLYENAKKDAELRAVLQTDYLITPDVIIARVPEPDSGINKLKRR